MKTTNNFSKYLAKATLLAMFLTASAGQVSSQKSFKADLPYKSDFIKQMVYQLSYDYLLKKGATVTLPDFEVSKPLVKHETWMVKSSDRKIRNSSMKHSGEEFTGSSALEEYLVKASHLKDRVEIVEEVPFEIDSKDAALEQFLIEATHLNDAVKIEEEMPVENENIAADTELEQFLTNAAQLKDRVDMQEVNTGSASEVDPLEEFLVRASHLKDRVTDDEQVLVATMMAYIK